MLLDRYLDDESLYPEGCFGRPGRNCSSAIAKDFSDWKTVDNSGDQTWYRYTGPKGFLAAWEATDFSDPGSMYAALWAGPSCSSLTILYSTELGSIFGPFFLSPSLDYYVQVVGPVDSSCVTIIEPY